MNWIEAHGDMLVIWIGAISTFAVYSILFCENKFYRFFEHLFLGCSAGLTVYIIWSQVLKPMWWDAMTKEGQWYLAFAMVLGSMFYFTYSKKHVWISRIIFGLFMGFAAGGLFAGGGGNDLSFLLFCHDKTPLSCFFAGSLLPL